MPRIPARLAQHPCRHVLEQPAASIALNPTEVLQPRHVGYTETFAFSCLTFPAPGRLDLERHACPLPLRIRLEHDTSIAAVPSPPSTFFPGLVLLLELLPGALHWSISKRPYEVRCKHTPSVPTRGCNSGGGRLIEKIRGRTSRHGHGWVGVADLLCTYVDSDGRNGARCIPSLYVTSIIKRRSLQGTLLWIATSLCFVIEACPRPAGSS